MATEVLLVKELNRLAPYESLSDDVLRGIPQGEIVKAVLTRPRNVAHHRKFFALLKVVYESQSKYATMGHVLTWFKKAANLGEAMIIDGKEIFVPGSISFAKMDQSSFEQFYNRAVDILIDGLPPKVNNDDLKTTSTTLLW
jgi:hypothetical protein